MNKNEFNRDEIAGKLLSEFGISVKPTDDIIPFYYLLMNLQKEVKQLEKKQGTQIVLNTDRQALFFSLGKWIPLLIIVTFVMIIVWIRPNRFEQTFNKSTIVQATIDQKKIVGITLTKGETNNYRPGEHYLERKGGIIIIPLK